MDKILVADDQYGIRLLIKEVLSKDFEIYQASDGYQAYQMVNQIDFDLIILDINMPQMSGEELLSKLKGNINQPKIILMSGYDIEKAVSLQTYSLNIEAYFAKPFDIYDLKDKVNNLLSKNIEAKSYAY